MFHPATPLTIVLVIAFVLLLISVLSTPIIKSIPLATYNGVDFGVFGYCQGSDCSSIQIGYETNSVTDTTNSDFDLPAATRKKLSSILIVHPIAAFFTLILLGLAISSHFQSPSHSPRYLMGMFILNVIALVLALLSFLIDVLLFVPHIGWGSYLVLAATILIAMSGVISCAMRRTLVSRKARKRRIAENAEMNGENYYNREGGRPSEGFFTAHTTDGPGADKMPSFATFEMAKRSEERTSDEQIPLTARTPSERSANPVAGVDDRYEGSSPMGPVSATRNQYGQGFMPPAAPFQESRSRDSSQAPSFNRQYSDTSLSSRGRGGMPPGGFRGRGHPANGRGGYGAPRGQFGGNRGGYDQSRGGFNGPPISYRGPPGEFNPAMIPPNGGAMMRGGGRGRGRGGPPGYGPPRGYDANYAPNYARPYERKMSQDSYSRDVSPALVQAQNAGQYEPYHPQDAEVYLPRAESPPPLDEAPAPAHEGGEDAGGVGQAVEMDATTGSPAMPQTGFSQFGHGQLRDSDTDVAGMVGLQQQGLSRNHTVISEASKYSQEETYVPPRQAWHGARASPSSSPRPAPAELAGANGPGPGPRRRTTSSDHYFEDVDPRFAEPPPPMPPPERLPGSGASHSSHNSSGGHLLPGTLDGNNSSYEDIQEGARSPAESERSTFTSVSQRGVNPRWPGAAQPAWGSQGGPQLSSMGHHGGGVGGGNHGNHYNQNYNGGSSSRRPLNSQRNEMLLNSNPDFQIPGVRAGRSGLAGRNRGDGVGGVGGGVNGGGGGGGSGMSGGMNGGGSGSGSRVTGPTPHSPSRGSLVPGSAYPSPDAI